MKLILGMVSGFLLVSVSIGNSPPISDNSGESGVVEPLDDTRAGILNEFYLLEQQTWQEYILRGDDLYQDTGYDAIFYHINADIAIGVEHITGDVRMIFVGLVDNLYDISLNLQDSLAVDSVTGGVSDWNHADNLLELSFDSPMEAGDTGDVRVYYQGDPPIIANTKGLRYATHGNNEPIIVALATPFLAHYWWPCKDGPGDKPDSVYLDITIPDTTIESLPLTAVSNGVLDGVTTAAGKKTFHWRERYPIIPFYVTLAVSNYYHFQDLYDDGMGESYPFDYYCFYEHRTEAIGGVSRMPEVAAFFSSIYGPYPFRNEKYAMSEMGFYGAIEMQTNTVQNRLSESWFYVSVHEFSHMWFGDMITCKNWHHGWLNEGFAVYSEALWIEHDLGQEAFQIDMVANQFFGGGTLYLQDVSDPMQIFVSIIYYKGAWALHMLRHVLGDEIFFECVSQYAASPGLMYGHATTEDFQNVCEMVSGLDLDWYFEEWIYGEYFPIYEISAHTVAAPAHSKSDYLTYVHLDQVQETGPVIFTMPVDLGFHTGAEYAIYEVWNDRRSQNFVIATEFMHDSVSIDPDNWILDQNGIVPYELHIIDESLKDGLVDSQYVDTITVICSSNTFEITVVSGSLPEGWSLDSSTGIISGITAEVGDYTFQVEAVDEGNPQYTDNRIFTIMVGVAGGDPGDANADGEVNVGDVVFIISYIFKFGPPPRYPNDADVNADCIVNVGDAVYMINYIFRGGPPLQPGCVE